MLKQSKQQSVDDPIDEADEAFSELDVLDDSNSMYMVSSENISRCYMYTCVLQHALVAGSMFLHLCCHLCRVVHVCSIYLLLVLCAVFTYLAHCLTVVQSKVIVHTSFAI